jgi:hypothetical protein
MAPSPRYKVSPEEFEFLINQPTTLVSIIQNQKKTAQTKIPRGSRASPGAWNGVNGPRILTEAQRQRKRERDQATKREEKAKNQQRLQELEKIKEYATKRIKELEKEVELLSKSCTCNGGGAFGIGNSSGLDHSFPLPYRREVSYDSLSNIGNIPTLRHLEEKSTDQSPDSSEISSSLDSPVYDYSQDNGHDYIESSYLSQEGYGMYCDNINAHDNPLHCGIQSTDPQMSYNTPAITPTTWTSTLHPVPVTSTHTYLPRSPHTSISGGEPEGVTPYNKLFTSAC